MNKQKYLTAKVLRAVADVTGITISQIISKCRKRDVVNARGIYGVVCSDLVISYETAMKQINRDRSMMYHYCSAYRNYIENEDNLKAMYNEVKNHLSKLTLPFEKSNVA